MRINGLMISLLVVIACTSGNDNEDLVSSDIRLDGAAEGNTSDSQGVQMCSDDDGQVYVVWSDDRDGQQDIWLNVSVDGGRSWLVAPVKVNHGDGDAIEPAIACSGNQVFVAWEDDRDGDLENHNIYFNVSSSAGQTPDSWLSEDIALDLDDDGRAMSLGPQGGVRDSVVHVGWFDAVNGAYDIFVATSMDNGATFGEPVRVDADQAGSAYSSYPKLALDDTRLYVVWEDSRDGLSDIYFSYSSDSGATFANDMRLDEGEDPGVNDSFSPVLSVEDGLVFVAWHDQRNGEARDVLMNWSSNSGGTWNGDSILVESDSPGFFDSIYPDVLVVNQTAHIAWQDARQGGYDIRYRRFADGAFDNEDQRLDLGDRAGFSNSLFPKLANGELGLVVAWEDRRDDSGDGYNDLYYNYSEDDGLTFQEDDLRIDNVEEGSKYANEMQLDIQRQRMLVTWKDGRGGNADVYFHGMKVGKEAEYEVASP